MRFKIILVQRVQSENRENNKEKYFLLNFFDINVRDQLQHLEIIRNLEHPSILKIIQIRNEGIYTKKNSTMMTRSCVIYEYPKGGELFEYLFQTGKFHEAQARHYFKQLVDGLVSIHNQGLYHGELTAEVIFFADAKTIKIGELGLNQIRKKKYTFETPSWAKENNNYEQSKDIFALGMILFILMVGRPHSPTLKRQIQILWDFKLHPNRFGNKYTSFIRMLHLLMTQSYLSFLLNYIRDLIQML